MDGDAVASLLVGLGIGLDGEDAVDLPFLKALEPQAFTRHKAADASAVFHYPLDTAGFQCMGNITTNAPAAGVAACITEIHRIAGLSLLVPLLSRLLDEQDTGALAFTVGQCGLSIPGGETAGSVRLLWMPAAKVYQHSVLCLVPVDSSEIAGVQRNCCIPLSNDPIFPVKAHQV